MKIDVEELPPPRFSWTRDVYYTHRVSIREMSPMFGLVSKWLKQNAIPHHQQPPGVFYLDRSHTEWLLLRWS